MWIIRLKQNLNHITQAGSESRDFGWIWIIWLGQNLNRVIWAECKSFASGGIWIMWLRQNLRYIFEYLLSSTELQYRKIKRYDFYDTHGTTIILLWIIEVTSLHLSVPNSHSIVFQHTHTLCPSIFSIQQGHQSDNMGKKRIQFPLRYKVKAVKSVIFSNLIFSNNLI